MKILIFLMLFSTNLEASTIYKYCSAVNGHVSKVYICPKSKIPVPGKTCSYRNKYNEVQFFNGCSGPTGGHSKIFFPACIKHDLCYHHEPATNGYSQKKCDLLFYESLVNICENKARNIRKCNKWAKFLYRSLRIVGKPAYHCANYFSHY